jgi:hypothetical protein
MLMKILLEMHVILLELEVPRKMLTVMIAKPNNTKAWHTSQ